MKLILSIVAILISPYVIGSPEYLASLPLNCDSVDEILSEINRPEGFSISVLEARNIAITEEPIIKPCASKLEQVIYIDSEYYYFTNSILLNKKNGFPEKAVKIHGKTGEVINGFDHT